MKQTQRKLTNMLWRSLGESMLLSASLLLFVIYYLYNGDYLRVDRKWSKIAEDALALLGIVLFIGSAIGYVQIARIRQKMESMEQTVLMWEKGNLSSQVPPLGEDEWGRLGSQLNRIGRKWEEQVNSLQRLSNNNAQLAEKARFSAIVEERQRLARELHDAVSQQLFAISMTATAVSRTLTQDFEKARRQVSLIEEMASVAQSEMRALLLHLRPVHLEGKRLADGLRELLNEIKAKVPIEISFEMDEEMKLAKGIEDHLFRIVQEALSNTLRHARANQMDIKLQHRNDAVRLWLKDDGIGFDPEVQKHASYGLTTMQERVSEVGGSFKLLSAPGKGTRIEIWIPLTADAKKEDSDADAN